MSTVYKLTSIFQLTTKPDDPTVASAHTGGWSESWWSLSRSDPVFSEWSRLQRARAQLLPTSALIIGYRATAYELSGNHLTPGGSIAGRQNYPGVIGNLTDLPQVALHLNARANGVNNANVTLRGIPDDFMHGGEYSPTPAFTVSLNSFTNKLCSGSFGFIGRDKSQASVRVMSASSTDNIRVNAIPSTGLNVGEFIRLNRVFDSTGRAVIGTFQVQSIVGNVIGVYNWPSGVVVNKPSGTLRRDQIAYFPYFTTNIVRASVKKVGSPLEKYRGRRSKVRR